LDKEGEEELNVISQKNKGAVSKKTEKKPMNNKKHANNMI
jgi:hypothetical protein